MTIGTIATTRRSTAAVVHEVQPRFDAPATTKCRPWPRRRPPGCAQNAVTASIARTTALVIGRRAGQRSSPVRRNLSHV